MSKKQDSAVVENDAETRSSVESESSRESSGESARTYDEACRCACQGEYEKARELYGQLQSTALDPRLQSLVINDLAVLDVIEHRADTVDNQFQAAIGLDAECKAAEANLEILSKKAEPDSTPPEADGINLDTPETISALPVTQRQTKVAILSLLFNWPSTGGGTIHTAETALFLSRAGYDVRHFSAQFPEWGLGGIQEEPLHPVQSLCFDHQSWNAAEIQRRFREALRAYDPDWVIITDSWNFKPLLAEAAAEYPYFLRLAALECLCPLNNVRLKMDEQSGHLLQCPQHQLATPEVCRNCVQQQLRHSGALHTAERNLSGFDTESYQERLQRAFREAEGVLVVNPLIAEMVKPYAKSVRVVPSGFDAARFPWPWPDEEHPKPSERKTIFFAGLVEEVMKGFHVLREACRLLWEKRHDFELVVTTDSSDPNEPFTRAIGWQSQKELPRQLRAADMLVFPTVAQEALGRSAVEAMGVGRAVIASRIGGLQFTVVDGATGLLFEPGDALDLANKIELLLDNPELCTRLGEAGRQRFEEHYTWEAIIEKHYRPLLGAPLRVNESRGNKS